MRAITSLVKSAAILAMIVLLAALLAWFMVQELGVDWTPLRAFVDWVREVGAAWPWPHEQMGRG